MVQTLFGSGEKQKKAGFFDRLKQAVASTKAQLVERIEEIVEGKEKIDPSLFDDLEATLITADLGVKTTQEILHPLARASEPPPAHAAPQLRARRGAGDPVHPGETHRSRARVRPHPSAPPAGQPEVIFVVGVNGVGKTTSIAKLAHFYLEQGRQPLLCAADTFRAAATEQLDIWAGRLQIEIIKQKPGADPACHPL